MSTLVDRTEVVVWERDAKHSSRTSLHRKSRVQFEVDGKAHTVTLTSSSFFSEADAQRLLSWAEQHGRGSHIDVRYDPSREDRAAFASAELSSAAGRIRNDLVLFSIAVIACAVLLALSKTLRAREARAAPDTSDRELGLGLVVAAIGAAVSGAAIYRAIDATASVADNWMGVPAGLIFLFGGILLTLPSGSSKRRNWLAKLLISCFALTFDWVAFGPGEREFSGSTKGYGFIPGQMVGGLPSGSSALLSASVLLRCGLASFGNGLDCPGRYMEQKS